MTINDDHSTVHRQLSFLYSPQSSSSIGASWTAAGSRAITSRSTPQSEQTMISPTSVPASSLIWASHSGQDTVDIVYTPLIFLICFLTDWMLVPPIVFLFSMDFNGSKT